jgi:hypothetical protein
MCRELKKLCTKLRISITRIQHMYQITYKATFPKRIYAVKTVFQHSMNLAPFLIPSSISSVSEGKETCVLLLTSREENPPSVLTVQPLHKPTEGEHIPQFNY